VATLLSYLEDVTKAARELLEVAEVIDSFRSGMRTYPCKGQSLIPVCTTLAVDADHDSHPVRLWERFVDRDDRRVVKILLADYQEKLRTLVDLLRLRLVESEADAAGGDA